MTRLLLLRHGATTAGPHIFLGSRSDPPLSAEGRAQAEAWARVLARYHIRELVVSPLIRARETARLALPALESRIDSRLGEIDYGVFSGLTVSEVARLYPGQLEAWQQHGGPPVDGEPLSELFRRTAAAALDALSRVIGEQDVLFVTHNGPIRALMSSARYFRSDPAAWQRVRTSHGRMRILRITPAGANHWRHLVTAEY